MGEKRRPGGMVRSFVLSAAACLASGSALAQCIPNPYPSPGEVPCYIVVQPIDVCGASGTSTCAPFNTTSANGVGSPSTAGAPFNSHGQPVNETSLNPIGFTVDPATGLSPPSTSYTTPGVDITRTLLNQLGVDLMWLKMATYNSAINTNTGTTFQTLNVTQTTNGAGATIFQSSDFLTLSYQNQIKQGMPTFGINAATNLPNPNPNYPFQPLGFPSNVINMFFVNTLNPPPQQAGGTLFGFSWIGNNGVAIAQNVFGYPRSRTSPPARPSTLVHELGHVLGLDHTTFAAGPFTQPPYSAPLGVVPPIPTNPLVGECDPSYPACSTNLMTTGSLRTESTVACLLAPQGTTLSTCFTTVSGIKVPLPTLANGLADQVNTPSSATSAQLPLSQQAEVLTGGSGLLSPFLIQSGFLNPIPHETTKAQLGTGGRSSDPIFDLSGPTGGRPGETLVAWVLTLPEEQTFAGRNPLHVVSKSRENLIQDVKYYPEAENNPLMRNIAYRPGDDNNSDSRSIGTAADNPCASATAECLMVKFQPPGLGAHASISFSKRILRGGAPITKEDLCKAKITYIFSDGYAATSNFGPCPPASIPLISSSWRPDPTVAPRIINTNKTNVLLAALQSSATTQAGTVIGAAYLNNSAATSAVIGFPHGPPDVTFSVPSPNPVCAGDTFAGDTLCFTSWTSGLSGNPSANYTLGSFLATGGATILTGSAAALAANLNNTVFEFTGDVTVTNGQMFQAGHDDGLQLMIGNNLVVNEPGPAAFTTTPYTYNGPSGTFPFDLVYGECCGAPAVLGISLPLQSQMACTPDPNNPSQCLYDPTQTGLSDGNAKEEADQPGQSCNNGTANTGIINGNVTVSAGEQCTYTSPCEITGNLTINGGGVWLDCAVDGNLTDNAGMLVLASSAHVFGNTQISQASTFTLGPGVLIDGNLLIQSVPGTQLGAVCGTTVKGNLQVLNNRSPIQIGETATQTNCPGNTIGGNLVCTGNNPVPISGSNKVSGHNQCSN